MCQLEWQRTLRNLIIHKHDGENIYNVCMYTWLGTCTFTYLCIHIAHDTARKSIIVRYSGCSASCMFMVADRNDNNSDDSHGEAKIVC